MLQTTSSLTTSKLSLISKGNIKKIDDGNVINETNIVSKVNMGALNSEQDFLFLELD